jgi:hypothetical protein
LFEAKGDGTMSELFGVALGGIIAAVSALVVVVTESLLRRRERQAEVREKRRQDAATLVGPVLTALRDLDPNANIGALRGNPRADEALREKWTALLSAQADLEVLGATHSDSEVSRRSESVITGSTELLTRLHIAITDREARSEDWWEKSNELRDRAMAEARSLVRAVVDQPA